MYEVLLEVRCDLIDPLSQATVPGNIYIKKVCPLPAATLKLYQQKI